MNVKSMCPLIQVFDMTRSLAFYRDIGFSLVSDHDHVGNLDWCLLKLGDAYLMLNTAFEAHERPPHPDPTRLAAHEDTGLFFECDSADDVFSYLRARGIAAEQPRTASYGMRQTYLRDPDGYVLCFQHSV